MDEYIKIEKIGEGFISF